MEKRFMIFALLVLLSAVVVFAFLFASSLPIYQRIIAGFFSGLFFMVLAAFFMSAAGRKGLSPAPPPFFPRPKTGTSKPKSAPKSAPMEASKTKSATQSELPLSKTKLEEPKPQSNADELEKAEEVREKQQSNYEKEANDETEKLQDKLNRKAAETDRKNEEEQARIARQKTQELQEEENTRAEREAEQQTTQNRVDAESKYNELLRAESERVIVANAEKLVMYNKEETARKKDYDNDPDYLSKVNLVKQLDSVTDERMLQRLRVKARSMIGGKGGRGKAGGDLTMQNVEKWFASNEARDQIRKGFKRANWEQFGFGSYLNFKGSSDELSEPTEEERQKLKAAAANKLYDKIKDNNSNKLEAYRALVINGFLMEPDLTARERAQLLERPAYVPKKLPVNESPKKIEMPKYRVVVPKPKTIPNVKPAVVPKTVPKVAPKVVPKVALKIAPPRVEAKVNVQPNAKVNAQPNAKVKVNVPNFDQLDVKSQDRVMGEIEARARKMGMTLEQYLRAGVV